MSQAWNSIDQTPTGRPETDRKLKLTSDNAFLYMGFNPPRNGPFLHPSDPRYKDPGEQYQLSESAPALLHATSRHATVHVTLMPHVMPPLLSLHALACCRTQ